MSGEVDMRIGIKLGLKIGLKLLLITDRNVYTRFRLVPKSMTLDDLEPVNGRLRRTISSEMTIFSHITQKYVANDN